MGLLDCAQPHTDAEPWKEGLAALLLVPSLPSRGADEERWRGQERNPSLSVLSVNPHPHRQAPPSLLKE